MNIFILHRDHKVSASYHFDTHVVKMITETAQILCTALHEWGVTDVPYKPTHKNHPCSKWSRKSVANFETLVKIGMALSEEYTYRYGRIHSSQKAIEWCRDNVRYPSGLRRRSTPYAQAMPEEFKGEDAVTAYRRYYMTKKVSMRKWKKRRVPPFVKKVLHEMRGIFLGEQTGILTEATK